MIKNICVCNKIIKTINNSILNNVFIEIKQINESKNNYEKLLVCKDFIDFKNKIYKENKISIYVNKIPLYDNNIYRVIWKKISNKIIIDL